MSYYYRYNFVSPEPIFAIVKEELKSYFDSGAIDSLLFPTWLSKCLDKLGKSSLYIVPTILHIDCFEARLPDNFKLVREAWLCTQVKGFPYRSANSFYSQAHSLQTIQVTPMVTTCDDGECLPEMIQAVYKTNNEMNQSFTRQHLLKPGNISTERHCSSECANFGSSSPDTFDIHGNKFITNFKEGTVYLIMYSSETDSEGYQLIPDNYRIREYIEAFIKFKCFELLSNQVVDETFNQIQQKLVSYKQASDEAYILAESEIKKQDVYAKERAIKRQRNSLNMYQITNRNRTIWRR